VKQCGNWKRIGLCTASTIRDDLGDKFRIAQPDFMKKMCPASCGVCSVDQIRGEGGKREDLVSRGTRFEKNLKWE